MMRPALTQRIETERLILRAPKAGDEEAYVAYMTGPRAHFSGGPVSESEAWFRFTGFAGHWAMRGFGRYIVEMQGSGKPVGHVGPHRPRGWPEPELTWTLWAAEAEGTGIAFEAASAARDHSFRDLGLARLVSYIDAGNARSEALAHRLGCTLDPSAPCHRAGMGVFRHPRPEGQL